MLKVFKSSSVLVLLFVLATTYVVESRSLRIPSVQGETTMVGVCEYSANMNVTNTSSPVATPTYVDSQEGCCTSCLAAAPSCKASVFNNYLCILYGAMQSVPAVSGSLCVPKWSTPAPSGSTPVPKETPLPSPVQPSSAPKNVSLVLRTECQNTLNCKYDVENNCQTDALVEDTCYTTTVDGVSTSFSWTCDEVGRYAEQLAWSVGDCRGSPVKTPHSIGACHTDANQNHRQTRCVSVVEEVGHPVYRRSCGSKDSQCLTTFFRTGECSGITGFERGNSMVVFVGGNFVWFRTYDSFNCTGPERRHRATPLDIMYQPERMYVTWSTVNHNITQAPLNHTAPETVGLMLRMECESSDRCSRELDSTCRSTAYMTDTCYTLNGIQTVHRCYPGYNGVVETYTGANCTGLPSANSFSIDSTCYATPAENYRRNSCTSVKLKKGDVISRTRCQDGQGKQCNTVQFISGQCNPSQSTEDETYLLPYCGEGFVWFETHSHSTCSGPYGATRTNPLNTPYLDDNDNYITWSCALG